VADITLKMQLPGQPREADGERERERERGGEREREREGGRGEAQR